MNYQIDQIDEKEYPEVVELWEASVRATHFFLKEEDILYFKPLILNEYLKSVQLKCVRDDNKKILGFIGTAERKIEMLFIHPDVIGQGIGKMLLNYALENLNVHQVDVNEDNPQAVGFYKHLGFQVVNRSELDSLGKPYPILFMELVK